MAGKRQPRRADMKDGTWRNRIVGHEEWTADQFEANPKNPKIHNDVQKGAMNAMLTDVGWVTEVIVNTTTGLILDGHMRVSLSANKGPVPVTLVELTEAEEQEVLAMMDPIGRMAGYDPDAVAALMADMGGTIDMAAVLGDLVPSSTTETAEKPEKIELKPLERAHVLVSVPLDRWDEVADLLDSIGDIEGVTVASTVN